MEELAKGLGQILIQTVPEGMAYLLLLTSLDQTRVAVCSNIEQDDAIDVMRNHIDTYDRGGVPRPKEIAKEARN